MAIDDHLEKQMLYQFQDLHHAGGQMKHIFPIHQQALILLLSRLPSSVDEVWVFGSSLNMRCGQGSDLDVCLVGDVLLEETKDLWVLDHVPLDLLLVRPEDFQKYSTQQGSIYHEIQTKGLKVWEKEKGLI